MVAAITGTAEDDPLQHMVTSLLAEGGAITPATFQRGLGALRRYLGRRYSPPLPPADIEEIASDAVAQLLTSAQRGMVSSAGNPTGYLLKVASNRALAVIRSTRRAPVLDLTDPGILGLLTDDQAAARLDDSGTAETVQQAMALAYRQHDATAVRVATYLLDHIQRTGDAPSSRVTAQALDLSHTGVAKALHRLRDYIASARNA